MHFFGSSSEARCTSAVGSPVIHLRAASSRRQWRHRNPCFGHECRTEQTRGRSRGCRTRSSLFCSWQRWRGGVSAKTKKIEQHKVRSFSPAGLKDSGPGPCQDARYPTAPITSSHFRLFSFRSSAHAFERELRKVLLKVHFRIRSMRSAFLSEKR